jgi:MFS family permease
MSRILWLALAATLVQQIFTTLGKSIVPVIGPAMTSSLRIDPELVGIFVTITGIFSTFGAMSAGDLIRRFGAMRVSQLSLVLVGAGLLLATVGWLPVIALGACVLGFGTVLATPASSEILVRYAPPARAGFVFSLKQTGVPAGTMLAGLLGPLFVTLYDWRAAILVVVAGTFIGILVLSPLTRRFDADTASSRAATRVGLLDTMRRTLRDPHMRNLALAQGAFVGLQNIFTTFFVTFAVVRIHYDLALAGQLFAAAQLVAVFSRVFWGSLGNVVGSQRLLGLLGIAMAVVATILGFITPEWPFWLVAVVALTLASTAVSWQGVMLSEVARLAPPGMVGAMTGGVISFGSATAIAYPLIITLLLNATGSYTLCFALSAAPPFVVALILLRSSWR